MVGDVGDPETVRGRRGERPFDRARDHLVALFSSVIARFDGGRLLAGWYVCGAIGSSLQIGSTPNPFYFSSIKATVVSGTSLQDGQTSVYTSNTPDSVVNQTSSCSRI
ncbi:MAG: hypothetical protein JWQ59_1382 [Cryobacterium sp.]|nr:hypothetical protein [Cryobacterium sp.]